ncbi:uncharacterized protein [Dipodomys merriami]|uniref:uncharacterized protein n=1 Tax=Dipodomys merriami TaxID=94247 RepID=UPI003855A0D6
MAASGSPGAILARGARRPPAAPTHTPPGGKGPTSGRSRRRRLRGGRRGPCRAERPSRSGGAAAAAATAVPSAPLFPFQRGSRRSRAREPGSSPARHLLPPLWKRPPPPRAARPGPRLRAAGPARLTGRRQPSPRPPRPPPSWRGPGSPFPAARARRSRAPAVRAPARRGFARLGAQVEPLTLVGGGRESAPGLARPCRADLGRRPPRREEGDESQSQSCFPAGLETVRSVFSSPLARRV